MGFNRGIDEEQSEQHSSIANSMELLPHSGVVMPEKLQKMVLEEQIHEKLRFMEFQKSDRIARRPRKQLAMLVQKHQAALQHLHDKTPDFGNYKNLVLLQNAPQSLHQVSPREIPRKPRRNALRLLERGNGETRGGVEGGKRGMRDQHHIRG